MYMPVPAISHAMTAPNGPVAPANVRGSEKIPAPTMPPITSNVRFRSGSFEEGFVNGLEENSRLGVK